jgi:hypothetical protein
VNPRQGDLVPGGQAHCVNQTVSDNEGPQIPAVRCIHAGGDEANGEGAEDAARPKVEMGQPEEDGLSKCSGGDGGGATTERATETGVHEAAIQQLFAEGGSTPAEREKQDDLPGRVAAEVSQALQVLRR